MKFLKIKQIQEKNLINLKNKIKNKFIVFFIYITRRLS